MMGHCVFAKLTAVVSTGSVGAVVSAVGSESLQPVVKAASSKVVVVKAKDRRIRYFLEVTETNPSWNETEGRSGDRTVPHQSEFCPGERVRSSSRLAKSAKHRGNAGKSHRGCPASDRV